MSGAGEAEPCPITLTVASACGFAARFDRDGPSMRKRPRGLGAAEGHCCDRRRHHHYTCPGPHNCLLRTLTINAPHRLSPSPRDALYARAHMDENAFTLVFLNASRSGLPVGPASRMVAGAEGRLRTLRALWGRMNLVPGEERRPRRRKTPCTAAPRHDPRFDFPLNPRHPRRAGGAVAATDA